MRWKRWLQKLRTIILLSPLLLILTPQLPAVFSEREEIGMIVGGRSFDFFRWEVDAFLTKANGLFGSSQRFINAPSRAQLVLDYLAQLAEVQQLEQEILTLYTDAAHDDAETEVQRLQDVVDQKRAVLASRQPLVEAIVQDQVGQALIEQGFEIGEHVWPPVMMHMTPLPTLLMVSPRDKIERVHSFALKTSVTLPEMEEMETAVYTNHDLSALVVPIGGLGTFPSMIQETTSINWLVEVTVHEWSHSWMSFYPVGWNYTRDNNVRVINETAASIIDREIRDIVVATHYPDYLLPPPPDTPLLPIAPDPTLPPPFDFRAEMAVTRIEVDRLLAAGEIETAEAYMEERRRFFVENGYNIRKLNQAYFAFYGAYAAEPGGATGADPIGPAVRQLRDQSPTLRHFMDSVAQVSQLADLEQLLEQ